jgi:hypothetical protein
LCLPSFIQGQEVPIILHKYKTIWLRKLDCGLYYLPSFTITWSLFAPKRDLHSFLIGNTWEVALVAGSSSWAFWSCSFNYSSLNNHLPFSCGALPSAALIAHGSIRVYYI